MILTDKAKEDFKKYKKWYFILLPKHIQWLVIYRWFNSHRNIAIDIQNWINDGYDYAVTHPYKDEVYVCQEKAGKRTKSFDINILRALQRANRLYNEIYGNP